MPKVDAGEGYHPGGRLSCLDIGAPYERAKRGMIVHQLNPAATIMLPLLLPLLLLLLLATPSYFCCFLLFQVTIATAP